MKLNFNKIYPNYMIILPLVVFGVFFLVPSTIGFLYAFTDWNPYLDKIKFVGLANFKEIVFNRTLLMATVNTLSFALIKTVTVTVIGIIIALILNRKLKTRNWLRTIYFLPCVFSSLVVGLIFAALFDVNNGVVNITLTQLGLANWTQEWLGRRIPALFTLNLAEFWRSAGYGIVITLAALQTIPEEYLEAATVDGAGGWNKFRHITLPMILPAINVNILFSLIYGLKMFDLVYLLTRGGPGHDTETFGTLILNEFAQDRYAQSVAINLVFTVLLVFVAYGYQKFMKRTEVEL